MELRPAPIAHLLARIDAEWRDRKAIFDLPERSFHRADPACDTTVHFHGERAATPLGPAAGPQSQLAQNIVLSWLAGGRIIELKTIQINDTLEIPRPCIDAANIGYNVEWSQELRLQESLHEYAKSWILLHWLKERDPGGVATAVPGAGDFIFDMSVGYDLKGIRDEAVTGVVRALKDAGKALDAVREEIPDRFAEARDLEVPERIIDCITLSTFHGCPADEIEGICRYLLTELDVHVVIKMNPTQLGYDDVDRILRHELGYEQLALDRKSFDEDLQPDQAVAIVDRLRPLARERGRTLGVKFSNTLVVKNHKDYFPNDEVMYMSGAPLHVLAVNLVDRFRGRVGVDIPVSFSAGVDARNFVDVAALGFVPATVCTDLLRPGGYGRMPAYLTRLRDRMKKDGVTDLDHHVLAWGGHAAAAIRDALAPVETAFADAEAAANPEEKAAMGAALARLRAIPDEVGAAAAGDRASAFAAALAATAGLLPAGAREEGALGGDERDALWRSVVQHAAAENGRDYARQTREDERYGAAANAKEPRKIGSKLLLFDCVNCDKCVPVCPNDANFSYDTEPRERSIVRYTVSADGASLAQETLPEPLVVAKKHQLANYADFCNECGNCDIFCPEDGGPFLIKPRFFGSLSDFREFATHDGVFVEDAGGEPLGASVRAWVRMEGRVHRIAWDGAAGTGSQHDGRIRIDFALGADDDRVAGAALEDDADVATLEGDAAGHAATTAPFHALRAIAPAVLTTERPNPVSAAFA